MGLQDIPLVMELNQYCVKWAFAMLLEANYSSTNTVVNDSIAT